jgi:hypothetical protein
MGPKGVPDVKTDWPTDRRSQNQLNSKLSQLCVHSSNAAVVVIMRSKLVAVHVVRCEVGPLLL